MDNNKKILDKFGELLVIQIIDRYYKWIPKEINDGIINPNGKEINAIFNKFNEIEKKKISDYFLKHINSFLFDFLAFFEENTDYKIYYEGQQHKLNLVELSENFKAEAIIEDGWLDRFSQFSNKIDKEA